MTLDKSLPYQQSLLSGRIAVLIVRARSNRIQDLLPVIPECLVALERIQPRQVVRVGASPHVERINFRQQMRLTEPASLASGRTPNG